MSSPLFRPTLWSVLRTLVLRMSDCPSPIVIAPVLESISSPHPLSTEVGFDLRLEEANSALAVVNRFAFPPAEGDYVAR